jgi:glucosamine--fructose-6-phosphate aminotransferase (isomerizing)
LVLRYLGKKIYPELASEYFNYLESVRQFQKAVLISQSGESRETIWCANLFEKFVCIVNELESPLVRHQGADIVVGLQAGEEKYSFSTFINTLIVLYLGHGLDPLPAIDHMQRHFEQYRTTGETWGKAVYPLMKKRKYKGFLILGSGPNLGAAHQAASVITRATKFPFFGMSMAQFDNSWSQAAKRSVVFVISPDGLPQERYQPFIQKIRDEGGCDFSWEDPGLPEYLSPLCSTLPFLNMAAFLRKKMGSSFRSPPADF